MVAANCISRLVIEGRTEYYENTEGLYKVLSLFHLYVHD